MEGSYRHLDGSVTRWFGDGKAHNILPPLNETPLLHKALRPSLG